MRWSQNCLPSLSWHALLIAGLLFGAAAAASEPSVYWKEQDVLVGVNYFPGWWKPLPNKWQDRRGEDWRLRFPERVPSLGEYNDQETMNREIKAAAEAGVDFFSILWYYYPGGRGSVVLRGLAR